MLTQNDKNMLKFMERYGGITIRQAYKIFYNNKKSGEQMARKRLRKLADFNILKYYTNPATDERIYYYLDNTKKLSPHDVYLLDFYSNLILYGADIIEFRKEPVYALEGHKIQPDGFFKFKYKGFTRGCFCEIDFSHKTNTLKYSNFFNKNYFLKLYGGDPFIVIISSIHKSYKTEHDIVLMDFDMLDFVDKILID